jgi:hypothetical protein
MLSVAVLALILALLVIVVTLLLWRSFQGPRRRVTRSVWCPLSDRRRIVTLDESTWDGRRLEVVACAAFTPPNPVACGKACLRLLKRPPSVRVPTIPPLH